MPALCMAACVVAVSSCDFLRGVAGRPTSEKLALMSERARLERAVCAARRDSAERVRRQSAARRADSLAAIRFMEDSGVIVAGLDRLGRLPMRTPTRRYSLVLGAFSDKGNADKLVERVAAAGYAVEILPYRNSRHAVLASCSDDVVAFVGGMRRLLHEPFCPSDAWVLVNQ